MSGRLFTEVREKRGLVYWVGAWCETPRGSGVMFLGASTTPQRCDETYEALSRRRADFVQKRSHLQLTPGEEKELDEIELRLSMEGYR